MKMDWNRGRWAPETRRAYESFWRDWAAWCAQHDAQPFPAKPTEVSTYLTERSTTVSTQSVAGRLAMLVAAHKIRGKPLRVNETCIRDAWAEIRRQKGTAHTPKQALTGAAMQAIIEHVPNTGGTLQDRAILLVGFKSAMRRSELVALDVEDLTFSVGGLHIHIRHSKTDKTGRGETVTIGRSGTALCAVAALEAWLKYASITSGPVFRTRQGRMFAGTVANIVKRWAAEAGIDPKVVAAHSLRSGCITTMQEAQVDLKAGMEHSRHKTPTIYLGYVQAKRGLESAAVKALGI
jgi:integrase